MSHLSGSALISGHLGHSHHLLVPEVMFPFASFCSKSSRMAKLGLVLGLAFSQNRPGSIGNYISENMGGFVVYGVS